MCRLCGVRGCVGCAGCGECEGAGGAGVWEVCRMLGGDFEKGREAAAGRSEENEFCRKEM